MQWFRSHHGAPFDTKLALVAKRANVTRGHAASLWWAVLDQASQAEPRGSAANIDAEELAAAFDYEEEDVERVLSAMRHKALLIDENDMLTGWDKRQVQREDEGAASRKQRQRSRQKDAASHDVTQGHTPEKTREDKTREEETKLLSNAPRVDDAKGSSRKKRKKAREYDADFLAWWESYPRREQKGDAFDAYWTMRDGGHSVESLQAGAEYAAEKYAEKELEWIPLPATFLRREGFLEAVEEVNGTAGPAPPENLSVDEKLDWWRDYGEKHAKH